MMDSIVRKSSTFKFPVSRRLEITCEHHIFYVISTASLPYNSCQLLAGQDAYGISIAFVSVCAVHSSYMYVLFKRNSCTDGNGLNGEEPELSGYRLPYSWPVGLEMQLHLHICVADKESVIIVFIIPGGIKSSNSWVASLCYVKVSVFVYVIYPSADSHRWQCWSAEESIT